MVCLGPYLDVFKQLEDLGLDVIPRCRVSGAWCFRGTQCFHVDDSVKI